jgi:hypothetical protein
MGILKNVTLGIGRVAGRVIVRLLKLDEVVILGSLGHDPAERSPDLRRV